MQDNLVKRKWNGCTKCCFCSEEENIQHLFFQCHMARWVWNAVSISFGFQPPSSMANLFGYWLKNFPPKLRKQILVGAAAIFWPCGWVGMMWYSKDRNLTRSCRYSSGGRVGSRFGQSYLKRKRETAWRKLVKKLEIKNSQPCMEV